MFGTSYNIKLPEVLHYVLESPKDRIIIVGDIHGCFDEFLELLDKCHYNADSDTLILVGDLCMKGPKSLEVIQFCCRNHILSVRGNVDENTLKQFEIHNDSPEYQFLKFLTHDEINYLYQLPYSISIPKINSIVVHAGLVPGVPLVEQNLDNLIRMRNILFVDGVMVGMVNGNVGEPWVNFWRGPQHVFFGHDAVRKFQSTEFATGLDGACCYGQELIGVLLADGQSVFVKVQSHKNWCHSI